MPAHSVPSGIGRTESTARPFHLSGGEIVSRLLGRTTTSPAPVPHHRFFSRSSHNEITQSDGNPLVRLKCTAGVFVESGKTSHRPLTAVPPISTPEEVSRKFATGEYPHGAASKSATRWPATDWPATHWPFFHLRMLPELATQSPPSRLAAIPWIYVRYVLEPGSVNSTGSNWPCLSSDTRPSRLTQTVPSRPRVRETTLVTVPEGGDNTLPSRARASSPAPFISQTSPASSAVMA